MTPSAISQQFAQQPRVPIRVGVLGASGTGRLHLLAGITLSSVWDTHDPLSDLEYQKTIYIKGGITTLEFSSLLGDVQLVTVSKHQHLVKNGDAFILVYKVDDRASFEFIRALHKSLFGSDQVGKPVWVCATRTDLPYGKWKVSLEEGEEFSSRINARFHTVMHGVRRGPNGLELPFAEEIVDCMLGNGVPSTSEEGPSAIMTR